MKKPVVLLHTNQQAITREVLSTDHPDLEFYSCETYKDLPEAITDCEAEVVYTLRFDGTPKFPRTELLSSPSVKWVAVAGSGTDHLAPWYPGAITVSNATGISSHVMAQYALMAMLHFSFNVPLFRAAQERQEWIAGEVEPIQNKTVLILGLGQTGQAVAAITKKIGLKTIGVRNTKTPVEFVDEQYQPHDLPTLWSRADFLVCCLPLSEKTKGMIDRAAFGAMKQQAVLVDLSRGGIVDEQALLSALRGDSIKGAALDVFEQEPLPSGHPFWGLANVLVTPHCSSVYSDFDRVAAQKFSANLTRYRMGEPLTNIVDPSRGY